VAVEVVGVALLLMAEAQEHLIKVMQVEKEQYPVLNVEAVAEELAELDTMDKIQEL
jgi:hypothetical protein